MRETKHGKPVVKRETTRHEPQNKGRFHGLLSDLQPDDPRVFEVAPHQSGFTSNIQTRNGYPLIFRVLGGVVAVRPTPSVKFFDTRGENAANLESGRFAGNEVMAGP